MFLCAFLFHSSLRDFALFFSFYTRNKFLVYFRFSCSPLLFFPSDVSKCAILVFMPFNSRFCISIIRSCFSIFLFCFVISFRSPSSRRSPAMNPLIGYRDESLIYIYYFLLFTFHFSLCAFVTL